MKTEDEWLERFGPERVNADGSSLFETFGADFEAVFATDPSLVWTVIEGEQENELRLKPGFVSGYSITGYVIASKPFADGDIEEWSETVWVDAGDYFDAGEHFEGERAFSHDPTATDASSDWFTRFGKLLSPSDILGDQNLSDDANLHPSSPEDRELIDSTDPLRLWTITEDADGSLLLSAGYDSSATEAVVNVVISEHPITQKELLERTWDGIMWYEAAPAVASGPK